MPRQTFVLRDGQLIERHMAAPLHTSSVAPNIRTDGMDPVRSMASGRMFDSKSAYYADVRAHGCEIVGNDRGGYGPRPEYRGEGLAADISRSIDQLRSR